MTKSEIYAHKVLDNEVIACKYIKQAAERFLKDLKRKDVIWDLEAVEKINYWFDEIVCVPEFREPRGLHEPHAFWLEQIHGFKYKDTGLRRFQSSYTQVARKNLKTFVVAADGLFSAIVGRDKNPFIMVNANSRDQAIICTHMMGKIVNRSPELKALVDDKSMELFTYRKKVVEIVYETKDVDARIEAMPRNPGDGGNPSESITDEFHEAPDTENIETAESGQGVRDEPFSKVITSPGHNKMGPCYQVMRANSLKVLSGKIEADDFLAIPFELDDEKEWDNIDALEKSNPMMPYLPTLRPYLMKRIKKAKRSGGAIRANIIIKNSGIWIDSPNIWIPSEIVDRNKHGIKWEDLIGKECYGGLDLSAGTDLNAFVLFFPSVIENAIKKTVEDETGQEKDVYLDIHAVYSMFWIPDEKVQNPKNDKVDYRKFVEDGWMRVFSHNTVEYGEIARDMEYKMDQVNIMGLGADSHFLRTGPVSHMSEKYVGENVDILIPVGQGFNLTGATEQVEQWMNNDQLDLMGNPVLKMCFQNTTLHLKDMNNIQEGGISGHKFPSKGKSTGRIDGVSGLVTAVHEYMRRRSEPKKLTPKIELW